MSGRFTVTGVLLLLVVGLAVAYCPLRADALLSPPPSAGVLPGLAGRDAPLLPRRVGVATAPVSLRYTFDGGVNRPITDLAGGHELLPLGQNGGVLRLVPQGQGLGLAVAYPDRLFWTCRHSGSRRRPSASQKSVVCPGRDAVL